MDASAVRLSDMRDQCESESSSRDFAILRNRRTIELLEDAGLLFFRNADAVVGNLNPGVAVFGIEPETDFTLFAGILHRISQQVENGLLQRVAVDGCRRNFFAHLQIERESLLV